MKNMYALKCLYQSKFYSLDNQLLDSERHLWEERIILIKAASMEEADLKCEKIAKTYEFDYVSVENQINDADVCENQVKIDENDNNSL